MSAAVAAMTQRLTTPFARGADTLELTVVPGGSAVQAAIAPHRALVGVAPSQRWSFPEHFATFDVEPDPRYVVTARRDLDVKTTVLVRYQQPDGTVGASHPLTVPAGTLAGESFVVQLGKQAPPGPALTTVLVDPPAPDGEAANWWGVTALLGNLAKLLWVTGWERDRVRRELARVMAQRRRAEASGLSLDLLGFDLGVPRFLPLPYTWDAGTVALLHLDDPAVPPAGQPDAVDTAGRYRPISHHGTNTGGLAMPQAPGRFGAGFHFQAASAELRIPNHADFSLGPARSFTVELFLKPDPDATGHVASKQANPGSSTDPGWALTVGELGRGLRRNLRWLVSDGADSAAVFADVSLASDRFQHVAGVIDRAAAETRLYVDGVLRATAEIGGYGALTNTAPVLIGRHGGAGAVGTVDELRLSSVARTRFDPALGEGDESYRRRLGIFETWTLPTPGNVQRALNQAVDQIAGDPEPLIVNDAPATLVNGVDGVRLVPLRVPPGGRIDQRGARRVTEDAVCGSITDEEGRPFDPVWLVREDDPRPVFAPPPPRVLEAGELPPDSRLMHAAASRALIALLDSLPPGQLTVESAFDPRAPDLRAVGRSLLLSHSALGPPELAAAAHVAGFDFVKNRVRSVQASVRAGEHLTVVPAAPVPAALGAHVRVGDAIDLEFGPGLPAGTQYEWVTIRCGRGRATVEGRADLAAVRLRATAPGRLTVRVEATRRGASASGTLTLRIAPQDLADGQTIAADGRLGVGPDVAAGPTPAPFFHPSYLIHHADPRIDYGSGVDTHRVQLGTGRRLTRLADLLEAGGSSPGLRVREAWDRTVADIADLRARGRRLLVEHTTLPVGALAARAHAAGFAYVRRTGNRVEILHREEEPLEVVAPAAVEEEDRQAVRLTQRASPQGVAVGPNAVYTANPGTDTVSEIEPASGEVLRAFKVGRRPVAVAVDPGGHRLYSADFDTGLVSVVDLDNGVVLSPIKVRRGPAALLHHPTQDRLFVGCETDKAVVSVDTAAGTASSQAPVGPGRPRLALSNTGDRLWVVTSGAAEVRVFKFEPLAQQTSFALPSEPADIALHAGSDRGWATMPGAAALATLDQAAVAHTGDVPLGDRPVHIAMSVADDELYVVDLPATGGAVGFVADLAGAQVDRFRLRRSVSDVAGAQTAAGPRVIAPTPDDNHVSIFDRGPAGFGLTDNWRLGSGLGERLTWIARALGAGIATFGSLTRPDTQLLAERAGPVLARAVYSLGDNVPPYTFEVRLKPPLDVPATVIPKDQYDQIMNVLNLLHPIGVEVRTQRIRDHVIEVREGLLEAFPDYTYPNFRVPGPVPAGPDEDEED